MEVDDPDLDAFESTTRASAQLRDRELGKIAALITNLLLNASGPESIRKSSHDNSPRESQCGASSHEQSDFMYMRRLLRGQPWWSPWAAQPFQPRPLRRRDKSPSVFCR